jgi:CheY-like chemotaxis protein
LYVEDDLPRVREEAVEVLLLEEDGDIVVYPAYDGTTALGLFKTEQPDAIILDIMMPPGEAFSAEETHNGLDAGLRFWERITSEGGQAVPVIVLTHYPDADRLIREAGLKPFVCLAKPVKPAELARLARLSVHRR